MTKKDYYNLLAQENLVKKVETTADDPNAFEHKVYKTSGGSENKLFRYDCDLTDEELNRAIQLKQLAKLNTIAHIREYLKVCVNLQTGVRYNYSVWRFLLWQEEKVTHHRKQQCAK